MASLASLIPLVLFLLVALVASIVVRRRADAAGGGFVNSYFIGNRALGGFVLAMTTIATYGSVSSFVGGPGPVSYTHLDVYKRQPVGGAHGHGLHVLLRRDHSLRRRQIGRAHV